MTRITDERLAELAHMTLNVAHQLSPATLVAKGGK